MAKVLYITANPKAVQDSFSLRTGAAFLEAYKANNPGDEIIAIDVFAQPFQSVDGDILAAYGELQSGKSFADLTPVQQQKLGAMGVITDQFVEADKYVFVTPLWDFGVPAPLKAYIDAVCVAGKTFKYTATGPVGLLNNKKALIIQASGGAYSQEPLASLESGSRYLRNILGFLGVVDSQVVYVEGTAMDPANAENIVASAIENAKTIANTF
jgi:FMN-dependent NADH-azoreductase